MYSGMVLLPILSARFCIELAKNSTAIIIAGAKKKLPRTSIAPNSWATPGEPMKPHPLKPVATMVLAPTKGPRLRPASRKPPSSLSLTVRDDIAPTPIITAKVTIISTQLSVV